MRERLARLETVERAAGEGDFVVVDYVGAASPRRRTQDDGARPPRPRRRWCRSRVARAATSWWSSAPAT